MRRLALASALLLLAAPIAGARSFEAMVLKGDLTFRAAAHGESALSIETISPGTEIVGPKTLQGLACRDRSPLRFCARLKRGRTTFTWTVLKPIMLMHEQPGGYTITLRHASRLDGVFISGCGRVHAAGRGTYSADGAAPVSYTRANSTVVIDLKP